MSVKNTSNVVLLNQDNVYDKIMMFLEALGRNSKNTRVNYLSHIKHFFVTTRNKKLNELTKEDLIFNYSEIERYANFLYKTGTSPVTINTKLSCIKSLFERLKLKHNYNKINMEAFNIEKIKGIKNTTGDLSWEEVDEILRRLKGQIGNETCYKGEEKALLIELAVKTSFRISALLNLKWSNFIRVNGVYKIEIVDKGKINRSAIDVEFYDRLKKYLFKPERNKVFRLQYKTVNNMMQKIVKEMKLKNRNITFHSFKRFGINEVAKITNGNVKAMQQQGNHSSAETTMIYLKQYTDDPSKYPCLWIGKELDLEPLKDISKEDWSKLIDKCDRETQMKLLGLAEQIGLIENEIE